MDRKAIIAIALSIVFLLFYRPLLKLAGLDRYLQPNRPAPTAVEKPEDEKAAEAEKTAETETAPKTETGSPLDSVIGSSKPAASSPAPETRASETPLVPTTDAPIRQIAVETPLYVAHFSSLGARLLSVDLKDFAAGTVGKDGVYHPIPRGQSVPEDQRVELAASPLFGIDLGAGDEIRSLAAVTYAVEESLDAAGAIRALHFTARGSTGTYIRQTYRVRPDTYGFDLEVELRDIPDALGVSEYSLTTRSWPLVTEADLKADHRVLRASSMVGKNVRRERAGGLLKGPKTFEGNVAWAGVQNRYFMAVVALVDGTGRAVRSSGERRTLSGDLLERLPAGSKAEQEVAINSMEMSAPAGTDVTNRFYLYVGPAEYQRLADLGGKLKEAVDLGWAWLLPFSRALLRLLNWLYAFIRNYGLAIVVLATLVRLVLHPLNMMSMKSMRAMQKIQPEVERIRQKYKNDPQAMNTAVMALYKENKVNPAGGCLPMLLQMPLFIALYQVLFNAIELRQAPFILWMRDLSAPDLLFSIGPFPVRLLPLLMTASGFLTQRMTPTDPRQMSTMYMMNVVMLVFFYNLPSGLVLYWTVMNFLTAFQQWLVLRQDGQAPAMVPAPASVPETGSKKRRAVSR